ncbi:MULTISPECIES: MATE family efflux transporter [unclassified Fusibacter]|uniref:MATE family efflux transporter n=1 Tax=unclassified Fusibacter TaxID=2624464 RepID=UPI0010104802|nr:MULTISPECIES: MATE family efflux transporter [unclassified Fusibacter]MCK8058472.1 MATE family efflux transporter [Fusibacter sp. A2]NPE22760.1 hypothetical protein [Fusibacter sp. A1]RXV60318.1 hypothetical protein DWB64_13010 [Fusibacter sp. A1]
MLKDHGAVSRQLYKKTLYSSMSALMMGVVGQMANGLFAGNFIGTSALAVIGLTVPVYYLFATVANMLGIGGVALCSKYIGIGEDLKCAKAATTTYLAGVILYLLLAVVSFALLPFVIRLLGTPAELLGDVYEFSAVMIVGGFFIIGTYLSFNFLRFDGKNLELTLFFILMAAVNVAFNYVFIIVLNYGVVGIAISTAIAGAAVTVFSAVSLNYRGNSLRFVKISSDEFLSLSKEIVSIGSPGAVENISNLLRFLLLNRLVVTLFGSIAMSTFAVVGTINMFIVSVIAGIAGPLVPFIGVFAEEKDIQSIKQILASAVRHGLLWVSPSSILCILFAKELSSLFGMHGQQLLDYSVPAFIIISFSFIPSLFNNIIISINVANGHTKVANALTFAKNILVILPLAYGMSYSFGIIGFWFAFTLNELMVLIMAVIVHIRVSIKYPELSKVTLLDYSVEKDGKYVAFSVKNNIEEIMAAIGKISEFCELNGVKDKSSIYISLALEEMLILTSEHSFEIGQEGEISVRILLHNETITLRIRNTSNRFNPIEYYETRRSKNVSDELELDDSIGIKMIIGMSKSMTYRRTFGINNLTIILSE